MRFEKWQALGNDYLDRRARRAAVRADPRARAAPVRPPLRRRRATACWSSRRPTSPASSRACGSSTPTAREAELSGNGAREAILYLRRRGWTDARQFSIQTAAGEIRPTITGPTTCRVDMGRAQLPRGLPRRRPTAAARSTAWRFQHVSIGNPQCAIRVADARRARGARPAGDRARRSSTTPLFPNRTNVSFWTRAGARTRIRARIFERGVGETLSLGHRRVRRRDRPRAARRRLAGDRRARRRRARRSTSTRTCTSTSPAGPCPVYAGELSAELLDARRASARLRSDSVRSDDRSGLARTRPGDRDGRRPRPRHLLPRAAARRRRRAAARRR